MSIRSLYLVLASTLVAIVLAAIAYAGTAEDEMSLLLRHSLGIGVAPVSGEPIAKVTEQKPAETARPQPEPADNHGGVVKKQAMERSKSASSDDQLVTVTSYGRRLGDIALDISTMTGYAVTFGPQADPNMPVVIDMRDTSLSKVLNALTANINYGYEINGQTITIQRLITKTFTIPQAAISQPIVTADMGGDLIGGGGGTSSGSSMGSMSSGSGTGSTSDSGSQSLRASVSLKKPGEQLDGRKLFEDNVKKLMSADGHYILDWLTSTVMVSDSPRNVELVERYVGTLKASASKQLQVEASISIVTRSDGFEYGIDWNILANRIGDVMLSGGASSTILKTDLTRITDNSPSLSILRTSSDVSAVLKALQTQGNVNVLSKPRVFVRNLQPVAIFSGKSVPYLASVQRSVTNAGGESTTSYNISRAQDGVMMTVQCQVRDDGKIDVQIAPILASIEDSVAFDIGGNQFTNPVSSVQQTLQSVTVRDGETIVIGGILRERKEKSARAIPLLSAIPFLGELFKGQKDNTTLGELVITLNVKKIEI